MNIKTKEKRVRQARLAYYNGEPIMSDREFDHLMDEIRLKAPDSRVLREVGAAPMGTTGKHSIPMGSLKEAKTMGEMAKWMEGITGGFVVMTKVDGLSLSLDYDDGKLTQALTRGNGKVGENVTANVRRMINVKEEIDGFTGTLRGEAYLPVATFKEKYAEDYANPRNTAAGIVRRHSGEGAEDVAIRYFYVQVRRGRFNSTQARLNFIESNLGLLSVDSFQITNFNDFEGMWSGPIAATRYFKLYEMDGVVVYVKNLDERGEGDPFLPDNALVYKFDPDVAKTKITKIEHVAGRSGRVNPRVHVEPTKVGGVTVTHATGNNYPWLKNLGVGVGAIVEISRRGDTIPAVEKVLQPGAPLVIPKSCPACESVLVKDGAYLKCKNLVCEAKDSGSVAHWLRLIELKGVGKQTLEKLVGLGIRRPYQLYGQTVAFWENNFGKSGLKIVRQLMDKKEVKPEYVLAAHVPNVGRRRFRAILDAGFTVEEILLNRTHALNNVDGIGEEIARIIIGGMREEAGNIRLLLDYIKLEATVSKNGTFEGCALKFTGNMSMKRADLEEIAEDNGGRIGWKKGFKNILVIADPNSASTKAKAARAQGHDLISEEEFMKRAGV